MKETWKPVSDFGDYEVSDLGRVRSLKKGVPLILKPQINKRGYASVSLCKKGKRYVKKVHHLVMFAFVGLRPAEMEICHNDGDQANNRLSNLRYDTRIANAGDAVRHGSYTRKLTPKQVGEIRELCRTELTYQEIANKYQVSNITICDIATGRTHTHSGSPLAKRKTGPKPKSTSSQIPNNPFADFIKTLD